MFSMSSQNVIQISRCTSETNPSEKEREKSEKHGAILHTDIMLKIIQLDIMRILSGNGIVEHRRRTNLPYRLEYCLTIDNQK